MLNYFNWTEIALINQDARYLSDIVSWEDASALLPYDLTIFFTLLRSVTNTFVWALASETPSSLITWIFAHSTVDSSLMIAFYLDAYVETIQSNLMAVNFAPNNALDICTKNPELVLAFESFINTFQYYTTPNVGQYYDSTTLNINAINFNDFFMFYFWLLSSLMVLLALSNFLNFTAFRGGASLNFFLTKFYIFANHFAFENRFQLDWTLLFLLFTVSIWVPLVMTYDDVNVEIVELLHSFIVLFLLFIICFLLVKYSIHYFSFLENTVSEGYSTSYIAKQFVRDVSNTFALFLRFFLLLFRLNIYDGLDDFLDSYYIFFIDFDEDSYNDEIFFATDFMFFFSDNREDVIFYNPTEFDWWGDIYSKFFTVFGKLFFFWALILEEIFRISLAVYISYLIIFEVHAVNVSINSDSFFNSRKL